MSDLQEIKDLTGKVSKGFEDLRKEVESIKGQIDGLDNEKLERMNEDLTSKYDTLQTQQKKLEAAINRPDFGFDKKEVDLSLSNYLRKGVLPDNITESEEGVRVLDKKSMSVGSNPDGGYLTDSGRSTFIADRIFETSKLRQFARVESIGTKELEIDIDDDEAASAWVAEAGTRSETSTPQLGKLLIPAHEQYAEPRATQTLIQDAYIDIESWLARKVADKFARTENTAFVSGNGVNKPKGFLSYSAASDNDTYERNKIGQVNLGATTAYTVDGFLDLTVKLKEEYHANAVFGMKRASWLQVLKLKGNDNFYFGNMDMSQPRTMSILGYPVVFMDDMPAVASNALSVVFADFSLAYTIVDRVGIQVIRDPLTTKPYIKFYTTKRVGGAVTNFDAIKIGKNAV